MQTYFRVTPPSVHHMVVELERRGLIRRALRQARSIELLVDVSPCLPYDLNRSKPLWRGTCSPPEQVAAILKKVPGMSTKESAAQKLVPRIVDYDNLFLVSAEVSEDAQKLRVKREAK